MSRLRMSRPREKARRGCGQGRARGKQHAAPARIGKHALFAIAIFELAAALRQHPEFLGAERANQGMRLKTVRMSLSGWLHWLTPIWFLYPKAMPTNSKQNSRLRLGCN